MTFKSANKPTSAGNVIYRVQIGAFSVKANAVAFLKEVQKVYPNAFITKATK